MEGNEKETYQARHYIQIVKHHLFIDQDTYRRSMKLVVLSKFKDENKKKRQQTMTTFNHSMLTVLHSHEKLGQN